MATRRALTTEALQLLANNVGSLLIGLIGTILVTRALGPEARGVYAWVLSVSSLAAWFGLLAQYNIIRKLGATSGGEAHWPTHLGSLTALNLAGIVLALPLLVWALTQPLGVSHTKMLLLASVSLPFTAVSVVLGAFIHLRRKTADTLLSAFIPRILGVLLILLAWFLGVLSLGMAVFLNVLLSVLTVLSYQAWLNIPLGSWRVDAALLKQASRFLGAGWLAGLALFAMPKVPLLLLPHHVSLADIGHFSLATTLLDIALMVPAAATSVLVSHFTRAGGTNGKRQALSALMALVGVMALVGYVVAPYIVPFMFGADFSAAVTPFRLLLLALLLQAPLAVLGGAVTAAGHNRAVLLPPLAGLATTLALSVFLLPLYGITGACWSIICGYGAQLAVLAVLARPRA